MLLRWIILRIYHSSDTQPEVLNNIHMITETYFESVGVMREIFSSEEGDVVEIADLKDLDLFKVKEMPFMASLLPIGNRPIDFLLSNTF